MKTYIVRMLVIPTTNRNSGCYYKYIGNLIGEIFRWIRFSEVREVKREYYTDSLIRPYKYFEREEVPVYETAYNVKVKRINFKKNKVHGFVVSFKIKLLADEAIKMEESIKLTEQLWLLRFEMKRILI